MHLLKQDNKVGITILKQRLSELDSLRGLAALSVFFSHMMLVFPVMEQDTIGLNLGWINILKYSPVHIFWGGHEAVIFFFVLSGFVLSLPFYYYQKNEYVPFLIRRTCRIYIPFIIAVLFGAILRLATTNGDKITGVSNWFNLGWVTPINVKLIVHHIFFLGSYDTSAFNPAIWSLVHEMRISIIFPFIMALVVRINFFQGVLLSLALSATSIVLENIYNYFTGQTATYFITFHYISMFIIGAFIAKNKDIITQQVQKLSKPQKGFLIAIGLVCYTCRWAFYEVLFSHKIIHEYIILIGVSIFIILSLSSKFISRVLLTKPIAFLGKISYSLYLIHIIILFAVIHTLHDDLPIWLMFVISFGATLIISTLSYYFVELPSIKLGRTISNIQK